MNDDGADAVPAVKAEDLSTDIVSGCCTDDIPAIEAESLCLEGEIGEESEMGCDR
jgi:hypothetical protein